MIEQFLPACLFGLALCGILTFAFPARIAMFGVIVLAIFIAVSDIVYATAVSPGSSIFVTLLPATGFIIGGGITYLASKADEEEKTTK